MNLIDCKKAFDLSMDCHYSAFCKRYGIQSNVITIIKNLYEDGQNSVNWIRAVEQRFTMMTGVRQGCILLRLLPGVVKCK